MESYTIFFGGSSTPRVLSANTASTTTITFVFTTNMTVTTAGWSFTINGSPLTLTSVSGSGTTWTFIVGTMNAGDDIRWSYDSSTGNTVSDPAGIEMNSASNQTVTNNISFEAETIAYMNALVIPANSTVYFNGSAQERTGTQLWLAVNTFVLALKGASIYTKFKAIYPMLGGTSARAKFNLIDPRDLDAAYRLTFSGPWVFSGTGAMPNHSTTYADTYLAPSAALSLNSTHISYYSRTNVSTLEVEMGVEQPASNYTLLEINTAGSTYFLANQSATPTYADSNSYGYYIANRQASNDMDGWKNGVKVLNGTAVSTSLPANSIYIGAYNGVLGVGLVTSKECAMSTIGDALTDSDALALSNAVEAFNVSLSRSTPPQILSATAISATEIEYVFDQNMSVTLAGWGFTLNGSPLSASSVTGANDTWTFTVGTMASGDTISSDYGVVAGNTVSAVTGIELVEDIYPVTNSIPSAGATVLQREYVTGGTNPLIGVLSLPVTAGSLIHIQYMGSIGAFGTSCTSDNGNTVIVGPHENVLFQSSLANFFIYNANAGTTTISMSGIANDGAAIITEYSGVKNTSNPLIDSGSGQGATSPLQSSLTYGVPCLVVMNWFNFNADDYTGLVGPISLVEHNHAGFFPFVIGENLNASATTDNFGVTTGGQSDNTMTVIAFELL